MLIIFHLVAIFIFHLLRNRKRLKSTEKSIGQRFESGTNEELELESSLTFDPPVYRQRYAKVYETIINEKWRNTIKTMADFGCAEFGLFVFVKNTNITELFCVDIDEELLSYYKCKLYPLTVEYLRRRNEPFKVHVLCGSVGEPDQRLKNCDMVTCIELVEHLYPDSLDAFPFNIFSFIEPKIAVITTPNVEFNVLFNKIDRFRHYDHKFEWTREQFKDWCNNIVKRFPQYTVEFCGMGDPPTGSEILGFCTQMATFTRTVLDINISEANEEHCSCKTFDNKKCNSQICNCTCLLCSPTSSIGICTYHSLSNSNFTKDLSYENVTNYKLLESIEYPFDIDNRSNDEKLLDTFKYRINLFGHVNSRFYVEERERCEIPIRDMMYGDIAISEEEISKLLQENGFEIGNCLIQETETCENCVILYLPTIDDMEEISNSSKSSNFDSDNSKYQQNDDCFSDWDEDYMKPVKPAQNSVQDPSTLEVTQPPEVGTSPQNQEVKPPVDPLNDSGYQKSISLLEDSPQTPLETPLDLPLSIDATSSSSFASSNDIISPKISPKKTLINHFFHSTNLSHMTEQQKMQLFPHTSDLTSPQSFVKNPPTSSEPQLPKTLSETQRQDLLEESLDLFEDTSITPNLLSNDNRVHLKKAGKESSLKSKGDRTFPPIPAAPPLPPALPPLLMLPLEVGGKFKLNLDRINELDKTSNLMNGRSFPNNQQQQFLKKSPPVRDSVPGPSNVPRKRKKLKKPLDPEADSPYDDAKSLANCIIENSLNRIDVGDLNECRILDLVVLPEQNQQQPDLLQQQQPLLIDEQLIIPVVAPVVENGDLANNNRDVEGNNFDAQDELPANPGDDFLNDNLEEIIPLLADNVIIGNNNDGNPLAIAPRVEQRMEENVQEEQIIEPPLAFRPNTPDPEENQLCSASQNSSLTQNESDITGKESDSKSFDLQNLIEKESNSRPFNLQNRIDFDLSNLIEIESEEDNPDLSRLSVEAIVDPNSERSSLVDFQEGVAANLPLPLQEVNDILPPIPSGTMHDYHLLDMGNVVLLGIRQHEVETPESMDSDDVPSMVSNGFPDWLLQILGTHLVVDEGMSEDGTSAQEEPHFYCQGDGLGVHPSVVGVGVEEEDDDADTENESTDSSSNHTHTDFAEIGPCPSEEQEDMTSLPEESQATVSNIEDEPHSSNSQANVSTGSAGEEAEENREN